MATGRKSDFTLPTFDSIFSTQEERDEVNKAIGRYNGILMKKGIKKVDESINDFIDRLPSLFEGFMSAFEEEIEKIEEKYED